MSHLLFRSAYHLGDSVFAIHYLRNLLAQNDELICTLFINKKYNSELKYHIVGYEDRLKLARWIDVAPAEKRFGIKAVELWHGSMPTPFSDKCKDVFNKNVINSNLYEFFEYVSDHIGLPFPFKDRDGVLLNNPSILENAHPDLPDEFDILLVNSSALSGQYRGHPKHFENFISELKDKYSIIVTKAVDDQNIPCTLDYGLNLMQIGNLSTKAIYIVAVGTAPIIPCMNIWSIDTVKKWAILNNRSTFNYRDNMIRFKDIHKVIPSGFFDESP